PASEARRPRAVLPRPLIAVVAVRSLPHRRPGAHPAAALVPARTRIAVVTRRPARHQRARADPLHARIPARPRALVVAQRPVLSCRPGGTRAALALVPARAPVRAGVAARPVLHRRPRADPVHARVAVRARVPVVAAGPVGLGGPARAHPRLARIGCGAHVAVVARRAVGLGRVRARPGRRVAAPDLVALIRSRAADRVAPRAHPALAGVGLGAGVAVVAGGAVGSRRVRALARGWVARAGVVALVRRRAGDRVAPNAAPALAGLALLAGVAVVAG